MISRDETQMRHYLQKAIDKIYRLKSAWWRKIA